MKIDPSDTALLICDMQNDFVHPDGAYARGGIFSQPIADTILRLAAVAKAARRAGLVVVSTNFTLVHGRGGKAYIADHLLKLRPFLRSGDFASGSWGNDTIDELQPIDIKCEKVAYNAFHQSRLEWSLRHAGISKLIACGIVTNGGLASTVRGAQVLEFETTVLSDGCATINPELHEPNIKALASVAEITTCAEMVRQLEMLPAFAEA